MTKVGIEDLLDPVTDRKTTDDNRKTDMFSDYFATVFNDDDYIDTTKLKPKVVKKTLRGG